ncbi:MAG: hypothetical protein ACE5GN_02410 [Waddliaceae bacterium]
MSVQGIHSHNSPSPVYDPYTPADPPREAAAKRVSVHTKDTMAPAASAGMPLAADLRPQLETPTASKTNGAAAIKPQQAELLQRQMYIDCVKAQQASREEDAQISNDTVKQAQQANKTIQDEIVKQMDEKIKRSKTSKILKWVNWVFTGIAAVAGIASIAITIATAGAALPAILAAIPAVAAGAAVVAGSLTIAKGVLDYKNKRVMGELEEKKSTRYLNTQKLKTAWEEMKHSIEVVFDLWRQLVQVMKNWLAAALNK